MVVLVSAALAPPARLRQDTGAQRAYLPRLRQSVSDLRAFARIDDEGAARRALEVRLEPLRSALFGSPWFAERLRGAGLSPRDLGTLQDLPHFPALERAQLAEAWHTLPALDLDSAETESVVAVLSSGSTGEPARVLKDRYDCLHMWAVLRFWAGWLKAEVPPRPRVVLLCALPGGLEYRAPLPLFENGLLDRISLARPQPLERLRLAAPHVLFSDPDGLHWLAAQDQPPSPRLVLTSALNFSPAQRGALRHAVPVPAVNYYATTETGPIAWECLERLGRFHVLLPDVWVESEQGSLLVTRLRRSVLPLLRYRTGDAGRVERDACPCGYRGWSILGFEGRRACRFLTPSGDEVDAWGLARLFKDQRLRAFRLTQVGGSRFCLEIRGGEGPGPADRVGRRCA